MTRTETAAAAAAPARVGAYRWVVLFACWASFTLTSIDRSTWGPASIFVGHGLGVPLASLGAFATAYYVGYVISNFLGGVATDIFGGRVMLSLSLLGAGIFMAVFGSATSPVLGIVVQALVGLFAGADAAAGVRLIRSWFKPSELGLPMGIFTTATSLGTAVANAVVPALIAWNGWGTSYHIFGGISVVLALALFLVLKPGPLIEDGGGRKQRASLRRGIPVLARNRDLLLTSLAGFGAFWGLYGFITWVNALMIKGYHIDPAKAGFVVTVVAITAVVVKPIIGFVVDRFFGGACKVPIMVLFGAFAVLLVIFGTLSSPAAFMWVAPLLGIAAYGWSPLIVALVPRLAPAEVTGSAYGFTNAIWQLGSVIVPVVVGAVFAGTHSFETAFLTLAAGPVVGVLVMALVRERRTA